MSGNLGGLVWIVVVVVVGWWGYNTFIKPDSWQGMYEVSTSSAIGVVKFSNKAECQQWLEQPYSVPGNAYNFECGSNCKPPQSANGLYRCKETF